MHFKVSTLSCSTSHFLLLNDLLPSVNVAMLCLFFLSGMCWDFKCVCGFKIPPLCIVLYRLENVNVFSSCVFAHAGQRQISASFLEKGGFKAINTLLLYPCSSIFSVCFRSFLFRPYFTFPQTVPIFTSECEITFIYLSSKHVLTTFLSIYCFHLWNVAVLGHFMWFYCS